MEHVSSQVKPFDDVEGEQDYDYSENAMGPKQMEDRLDLEWDDGHEWTKTNNKRS